MAKSHPKRSYADEVRRTNNSWLTATASLIFIACLISIAIVLNRQSAVQLPAPVVQAAQQAIERVEAQQQAIEQEAAAPPEAVAATPAAPALVASAPAAEAEAGQYRALAEYVARRYRVSQEETANIVALAYGAGHGLKIDPLLILAVISVESRFNPIAESVMGAKGLMQVIPKFHLDKFRALGGEEAAFDPLANIMVGAQVLKSYLRQTGDLMQALRLYVGASEENENDYADKVIVERDRLQQHLRTHTARTPAASTKRQPDRD